MNRTKAALIHLSISAIVALLAFLVVRFVMYPGQLFRAVGVGEILLIALAVDVVIGPLLTAIVYKPNKPSLRFDLSVIAVAQVLALCFGMFSIWNGRPVFIVSLGHRFDVIQASEIADENLQKSGKSLPFLSPKWVGIKEATDEKRRNEMLDSALAGNDYGHFPEFHVPFNGLKNYNENAAKLVVELILLSPNKADEINAWMEKHAVNKQTAKYYGLRARAEDMAVVFDSASGVVYGIAPFKPW